jgi:hypothetical protein
MIARGSIHGAVRMAIAGMALLTSATMVSGQDLSRYRTYVLGSPLADVAAAAGIPPSESKTSHERPVLVQQLEWRPPYKGASDTAVDPVEAITFSFIDGHLYQLNVAYSRALTRGMTTADLVSALTVAYGAPARGTTKSARGATTSVLDATTLARWADAQADITLSRSTYGEIQLIVRARELGAQAKAGINAALVLDAAEAPLRRQQALEASAADDLAERTRNKTGFKP